MSMRYLCLLLCAVVSAGCAQGEPRPAVGAHGPEVIASLGGVLQVTYDTTNRHLQARIEQRCGLVGQPNPSETGQPQRSYTTSDRVALRREASCARRQPHVLGVGELT